MHGSSLHSDKNLRKKIYKLMGYTEPFVLSDKPSNIPSSSISTQISPKRKEPHRNIFYFNLN